MTNQTATGSASGEGTTVAATKHGGRLTRLLRNDNWWAGTVALLALLVLALGLTLWWQGSPAGRGPQGLCWPASMACWAVAYLLRARNRLFANLLLALAAALLVTSIVLQCVRP